MNGAIQCRPTLVIQKITIQYEFSENLVKRIFTNFYKCMYDLFYQKSRARSYKKR